MRLFKRIEGNRTGHATKIPLNTILKVSKSICKIIYEKNNVKEIGTGFFMLLDNNLKSLVTCSNVVSKGLINKTILQADCVKKGVTLSQVSWSHIEPVIANEISIFK